jgi:hypothetical protein
MESSGTISTDREHDPSGHYGKIECTENVERPVGVGNDLGGKVEILVTDKLKSKMVNTGMKGSGK